jgi:3-dehydroquinate dehydratase/shikimate dehydrogenase
VIVPLGVVGTAQADIVATVTTREQDLSQVPAAVTHLEVRADLTGDLDPARLTRRFAGRLVYSLRSVWHGGACADPPGTRRSRLAAAVAAGYHLVDLEASHDLVPEVLDQVPADRRRISWHGGPLDLALLRAQFNCMADVPARMYLLAPAVATAIEAVTPLRLLAHLRRADVTAFGAGPTGTWSRLLAPWLGAPVVFGRLSGRASGAAGSGPDDGAGVPTVDQLLTDYPFPALPELRQLYGVVGRSVATSLYPRLNNLAYPERELPALFLPFQVPDRAAFLTRFWPGIVACLRQLDVPLRGLTVAAPLKEVALAMADQASPTARAAGAANALIQQDGRWRAETTDASAILTLLRRARVPLDRRRAAVIGCGGTGRAAAVGLLSRGAEVVMVNRSGGRGRLAADLLGLPFAPLESFTPNGFSVLVNATPYSADPPLDISGLAGDGVVLELAYGAGCTALVAAARHRGLRTIDGWDVLSTEVAHQFRLMTGRTMKEEPCRPSSVRSPSTPSIVDSRKSTTPSCWARGATRTPEHPAGYCGW